MKKSQLKGRRLADPSHGRAVSKTLRFPKEAWQEFNTTVGMYSANDVQLLDMRRPIDGYFEVEWEQKFREG